MKEYENGDLAVFSKLKEAKEFAAEKGYKVARLRYLGKISGYAAFGEITEKNWLAEDSEDKLDIAK